MAHSKEKELIENIFEKVQTLDLVGKYFKSVIINMLQELRGRMDKQLQVLETERILENAV